MRKAINRGYLLASIISAVIFLIIAGNYSLDFIASFDENIVDFLFKNTNYILVFIFKLITMLGNWQAIILGVIILFVVVQDKFMAVLIAVTTLISSLINSLVKGYFMRPRPAIMHLTDASGYSFPSGHAMISTIFYGMILVLLVSKIKNKKVRYSVYTLIVITVLSISISRVYLRVHFLSDVIAGMAMGVFIVSMVMQFKTVIFDNIKLLVDYEGEEE